MRVGKFSALIRVSFANACVSKSYANGEWFGFDVHVPPFFCALFPGGGSRQTSKPLGKQCLPPFSVCRLIALQIPGVRSLRRLPCAPRLRLRCSRTPPCGVWVPPPPRLRRTSRPNKVFDFLGERGQNSPFREFRGHGNFEGEIERTACPRFSKRRKMPPIYYQSRNLPVSPVRI